MTIEEKKHREQKKWIAKVRPVMLALQWQYYVNGCNVCYVIVKVDAFSMAVCIGKCIALLFDATVAILNATA